VSKLLYHTVESKLIKGCVFRCNMGDLIVQFFERVCFQKGLNVRS